MSQQQGWVGLGEGHESVARVGGAWGDVRWI